jgi:hypothetical protein
MALSRRKPTGYPEISFLSFDVLALLAKIQNEMGLEDAGPVTFSLKAMETLACICWEDEKPGGDIFFHSLFNRPDVPQPVIEHVLRHELLHLKIPARVIDGKLVHHPPEFWEAEQALVPWKSASWGWMHLAFWEAIKPDIPNECVWVKKSWRKLQKYPYPSWEMILDDLNRFSDKQGEINDLMEGL